MTELPKSIRVGYLTYAVEPMNGMSSHARDVYGECDNAQHTIRVYEDLPPLKHANAMLHEVLHACWYIAGLENEDKEERVVGILANQISQVWRDNPQLVAWLNERLNG